MRHRRGTPGLTPYRLRTIEAGYPRRRRPARHLRRRARRRSVRHIAGAQIAMGLAGTTALALLIAAGYAAAAGAVVVLGMF